MTTIATLRAGFAALAVLTASGAEAATFLIALGSADALADPDPARGAQLFRACAACHSTAPDRNMTGPSLAGIFGRKAGTLASFERYSPALKSAGISWNATTLNAWLQDPAALVPGNRMTIPGIRKPEDRADLVAFLEAESAGRAPPITTAQGGGMMDMMGAPQEDLKNLGPDHRVTAIRLCHDTYNVATEDGKFSQFWEPNLRFKTDSGGNGPASGKPALVPAGMMGDRADVIFATPEELASFIKHEC